MSAKEGIRYLLTNKVFASYCMLTGKDGIINDKAMEALTEKLHQQCSEIKGELPIIDEEIVADDDSEFTLHTETMDDGYYIALKRIGQKSGEIDEGYDKQEICISSDCTTAYVINSKGNEENCYSYERPELSFTYARTLVEHISTGKEELTDAQRALLEDAYEVLDVEGLSYKRVMVPYASDRENGCYANEYGCLSGPVYFSFSKGAVGVRYIETNQSRGFRQELWLSASNGDAELVSVRINGIKTSYEKCDLSEKAIEFFKKLARVLKKHEFDVSKLPAGFTDQTQYSE